MASERSDLLAELTDDSDEQEHHSRRSLWLRSVTKTRLSLAVALAIVVFVGAAARQASPASKNTLRASAVIMAQGMPPPPDAAAVQPQDPEDPPRLVAPVPDAPPPPAADVPPPAAEPARPADVPLPAADKLAPPTDAPIPPADVPASPEDAPATPAHEPAAGKAAAGTPSAEDTPAPPATTEGPDLSKFDKCADQGQDCTELKCCKESGMQCYVKSEFWAECRTECAAGKHLTDPDSSEWTCDALGDRTPGEAKTCAKDGEDCRAAKCCESPGTQCYEKMEYWAACKPTCQTLDFTAPDSTPWSCAEIGPRAPGAGAWVAEECSQDGEDCTQTQCCAESGKTCYRKNEGYSTCRYDCPAGFQEAEWDVVWDCEALGPQTPPSSVPAAPEMSQVSAWVEEECVGEGENCLESKCCRAVGWQCYNRNDFWAQCLPANECPPPAARRLGDAAAPAADAVDAKPAPPAPPAEEAWSCTPVGPPSWGVAIQGYPSLYCVSLYMPGSYEGTLMNKQLEVDGGIFACDGFEIIAAEDVTLGSTKAGKLVKSVVIPKIEVGVSQDGTAGNAKLFMAMWDSIIAGKRFRDYDWTIKADPDAVLVPWRLRDHMRPHVGENIYVVNCNKFPSSPNFPMMFGSVEIFSMGAMYAYAEGSWKCGQELEWKGWGEDYYMTHCLDYLAVGRINDFSVVGDNVCTGANCGDAGIASFHPFKTAEDWEACWNDAAR